MNVVRLLWLVVLVTCSQAAAQTSFPRVISSNCNGGATRFTQETLEFDPHPPRTPLADFSATGPGNCDRDVLFTFGSYWRLASDQRLSQFYDDPFNPSDQGGITQLNAPDSWTVRWPDADDRGVLDATWTATVQCCGRRCGSVTHEWTLVNTSDSLIELEFYTYADLNFGLGPASLSSDLLDLSTPDRHLVSQSPLVPTPCDGFAEAAAVSPDPTFWEANGWPALESNFLSPNFTPLSNASLMLQNADYEGAFGWRFMIPAGGTRNVVFRHGHNSMACDQDAAIVHYGSASGPMTIESETEPVPGCALEVEVSGPANSAATVLIGLAANLPLPGCPQTLLVDPVFITVSEMLDASGDWRLEIPAASDPVFCGRDFSFQGFALSPGEPCVPLVHTDGMTFRFGN